MADQARSDRAFAESEPYALVEAFIDGERVDPTALKDALADADARDHLVDLLLIRGAIGAMVSVASTETSKMASPTRHDRRSRVKWMTAAAATVLVSLTVGYAAGQRVMAPSAVPSTVEVVLPMQHPASAPAPTRSITFTPGVNWTEASEAEPGISEQGRRAPPR